MQVPAAVESVIDAVVVGARVVVGSDEVDRVPAVRGIAKIGATAIAAGTMISTRPSPSMSAVALALATSVLNPGSVTAQSSDPSSPLTARNIPGAPLELDSPGLKELVHRFGIPPTICNIRVLLYAYMMERKGKYR